MLGLVSLMLGWMFLDAFSLVEEFTLLEEDKSILGRPNTNVLNPSPRLRGHPTGLIGPIIPFF